MNLASCDFFPFSEKFDQFYSNSIDCTTPSGPDMKYSIWIFNTFRFTLNFDYSVQMVEMGWFPIRILDDFIFSPIYELSVQMAYPTRSLERDKAIEVKSEIIRTRLGC